MPAEKFVPEGGHLHPHQNRTLSPLKTCQLELAWSRGWGGEERLVENGRDEGTERANLIKVGVLSLEVLCSPCM